MPSGGAYPAEGERSRGEGRWDNGLGRKEQRQSAIRGGANAVLERFKEHLAPPALPLAIMIRCTRLGGLPGRSVIDPDAVAAILPGAERIPRDLIKGGKMDTSPTLSIGGSRARAALLTTSGTGTGSTDRRVVFLASQPTVGSSHETKTWPHHWSPHTSFNPVEAGKSLEKVSVSVEGPGHGRCLGPVLRDMARVARVVTPGRGDFEDPRFVGDWRDRRRGKIERASEQKDTK
ncbi:hypothetical protein WN48_04728 [Eufriesea mexicana]|nr:hypothetical protein WN48_04728 [Eufriesea mexicana]